MAYIRKLPSGKWQATVWVIPKKKRDTETFLTKKAAERWGRDREVAIAAGTWRDPNAGRTLIGTFGRQFLDAMVVEPGTRYNYEGYWRRNIEPRWGDWALADPTQLHVQQWVNDMVRNGPGAPSVPKVYILFAQLMKAAVRNRLITYTPCEDIQLPTVPQGAHRYFTRPEAHAILHELKDPTAHAMAGLGLYSGPRYGEIAALRIDRIQWARHHIRIVDNWTKNGIKEYPKTSKSNREIPVPDHVMHELAELAKGRPRDALIFQGPRGDGAMKYATFWDVHWKNALRRARTCLHTCGTNEAGAPACVHPGDHSVQYSPPHTLRHTAASWLVMDGVDLYRVMHFLGHESYATTQRYAHLAPDASERIFDAWSRLGPSRDAQMTHDASGGAGSAVVDLVKRRLGR